jgi:hypothetical protein
MRPQKFPPPILYPSQTAEAASGIFGLEQRAKLEDKTALIWE